MPRIDMEKTEGYVSRAEKDPGLTHSLDLLSDTYNYNHWIYSLCRPWLGDEVLEVGSGIGNLTQFLLGANRLVCLEPEDVYRPYLSRIAEVHRNVRYYPVPVEDMPADENHFISVLCVNVLEHIKDDEMALRKMAGRLRDGGNVVLYVPAVSWAYGEMDSDLGHWRRYNKRRIREIAEHCGLSVVRMHHVNAIGLFGWWWVGRVRKERLIDPRKARVMDALAPYLSAVERIVPPFLGQSLLAVLRK